jgi:hypothetical protein
LKQLIFGIYSYYIPFSTQEVLKILYLEQLIYLRDNAVRKSEFTLLFTLFSLLYILFSIEVTGQIAFGLNSAYKYLKGKDASLLSPLWNTPGFNDSGWASGNAPFRYGDGTGGTVLTDMQNSYTTVYLRSEFTATNVVNIGQINILADFDDGFIIWINGVVAVRENAPESPAYNSLATASRESGTLVNYILPAAPFQLQEGLNSIAVQGFNNDPASSDFYFGMSILANLLPSRVSTKPAFSHIGGFYSTPFTLTISSPISGYNVAYTLDGSNPENSPTRVVSGASASVIIDPLSSVGRSLTPAVIVRASLTGTGYRTSFPEGRTYIFTSEVPKQQYPGGSWPSSDINGQIIDLPMDSKVVNDSRYSSQMDFSLKAIPSFSIITDIKYLFDPDSGLYVNAYGHGEEWERECSVELLNPDGSTGFHENAGLRIRGGWSRHPNYPKHAFRFFFNSQYGAPKLNFPLFGNEGASKFDKIDLRCEQNYSWANAGAGGPSIYNTCIREVFSRDTQRDMKQPYSRSRYYHLYLNGMYWGLYQTQERTEANYAATYLGGVDTDYDVVKVNTEDWNYRIEATDGNLSSWQSLYALCDNDKEFVSNSTYFNLEGKDSNGNRILGDTVLVDIDNLIDYMLVIFYTGNFDSPTSSFGQNKGCNNFFAIYNKTLKNQGFTFYAHDSEHALMSEVVPPGTGLYEDRVNLATRTGGWNMVVNDFSQFHPQWLHEKLTENAEYRLRFADRAYNYLRAGNVLSEEACLDRFNVRAAQLYFAIIAESARWGDSKGTFPVRTKDDYWVPELNKVRTVFFPARSLILADQLWKADLYPSVMPSLIKIAGQEIQTESLAILNPVTVAFQNPNPSGDVYYTLDNSDPRLVGGSVNPNAIKWLSGTDFVLNHSAAIKTRVYQDGVWSALNFTNILNSNEDYTKLKVTELMYHPLDVINGIDTIFSNSLEFIEFKNTGSTSINISGMKLDSAVHCEFPVNTLLAPQQFFVVASKPHSFTSFYGFPPSANYSGNFSNGGEYVLLTDPLGNKVLSFTYSDASPWPVEADGEGFSLNSVENNPTGDPNNYSYWKSSNFYNGTPFTDEFGVSVEKSIIEEVNINIYPNPASDILNILVKAENNLEDFRIGIYNFNGVLMYDNKLSSESSISLKEFGIGPGIYIVKVEGVKLLRTHKLVVIW